MTHCNRPSLPQQRRLAKQAQKIDANHFFNLLTGPQLLEAVEAQLPDHRERHYPPTLTLSMFLGQVMSADGSCQNTVNEALVNHRVKLRFAHRTLKTEQETVIMLLGVI
jgi:hypothetical protein